MLRAGVLMRALRFCHRMTFALSGDIFVCHTWGRRKVTSIYWVDMRDAAKHSAKHRIDPTTENYPTHNDNRAKVGKLWLRVWRETVPSKEGVLIDRRRQLRATQDSSICYLCAFPPTVTYASENNNSHDPWACEKGK